MALGGRAFGFVLFLHTELSILLAVFGGLSLSLACAGLLASTVVTTLKQAQTLSLVLLLVGFVLQTFMCGGYGTLVNLLYSDAVPPWVTQVSNVLVLYGPYCFAKVYYDLSSLTMKAFSPSSGLITSAVEENRVTWANMTTAKPARLWGLHIDSPPSMHFIWWMYADAVLYLALTLLLEMITVDRVHLSLWSMFRQLRRNRTGNAYDAVVSVGSVWKTYEGRPLSIFLRVLRQLPVFSGILQVPKAALKGISFEMELGDVGCILGKNGAGKSTLLNIMTGILVASEGDVSLGGCSITWAAWSARRKFGYCPQHDSLWMFLTVRQNMQLFATLRGVSKAFSKIDIERRIDEVGLKQKLDALVSTLSGGMKRRLSFAVALLGSPAIVICDEPTAGLDVHHQHAIWKLISSVRSTFLLTSHSTLECESLASKFFILDQGILVASGPPMTCKAEAGADSVLITIERPSEIATSAKVAEIQHLIPEVVVSSVLLQRTQLRLSANGRLQSQIPGLIEQLQSANASYSLAYASLDDLLSKVTSNNGDESGEAYQFSGNPVDDAFVPSSCDYTSLCGGIVGSLLIKAFRVKSRHPSQLVGVFFTPLLALGVIVYIRSVIISSVGAQFTLAAPAVITPVNLVDTAMSSLLATFLMPSKGDTHIPSQPRAVDAHCFRKFWYTSDTGSDTSVGSCPKGGHGQVVDDVRWNRSTFDACSSLVPTDRCATSIWQKETGRRSAGALDTRGVLLSANRPCSQWSDPRFADIHNVIQPNGIDTSWEGATCDKALDGMITGLVSSTIRTICSLVSRVI
jgi:ABC-type multidrug transport system ATPase subunit